MKTDAMKKLLVCLLLAGAVRCAEPSAFAAYSADDAGTASVQVLKLGAGARAAGMGSAFAAAADDASAVYWNPGALPAVGKRSLSLMHNIMFGDIYYDWAGYVRPAGSGAFGVGIQRLSYGNVTSADETGLEEGSFSPSETVGTFAYGVSLGGFGLGAGLKYISAAIKHSAQAFAADAGVKYAASRGEGFEFALVAQNMGSRIKYLSESDPLPLNFKFGTAYRPGGGWLFAADADMPRDNALIWGVGGEYGGKTEEGLLLLGRAGYNSRAHDLGGLAGFTVGAGCTYEWMGFDYAFVPFGALGNTHKLSVTLSF
jgi:hypothetical protein